MFWKPSSQTGENAIKSTKQYNTTQSLAGTVTSGPVLQNTQPPAAVPWDYGEVRQTWEVRNKSTELSDQPSPGPSRKELTIYETSSHLVLKNIPKFEMSRVAHVVLGLRQMLNDECNG